MKKLNFIIGKRQLMITALLLFLSVAAFLNWQFATGDQTVTVMDVPEENNKISSSAEESNSQKYGEPELVSNNNYFTIAKLNKKNSNDENLDNLNRVIKSTNSTNEQKEKATEQALKHIERCEKETSIENQVRGKLAKDCIAYLDQNDGQEKLNIHVQIENLDAKNVAIIKNIAQGVTKLSASNITITPVAEKNKQPQR